MKVILAGPPRSGKSCLRDRLSRAISLNCPPGRDYLSYVITACPDGEGSWYAETHHGDPGLADSLKKHGKGDFNDSNTALYTDWVKKCKLPLTLIDIGGKTSEQNRMICAGATHAVLVFSDETTLPEWRTFCNQLGLQIIAEIRSDLQIDSDVPLTCSRDGVYRGTIHNLVRGELQIGSVESSLAQLLLSKCGPDGGESTADMDEKAIFRLTLTGDLLDIGFGKQPAQNTDIVPQLPWMLEKMISDNNISRLTLLKVNGRCSLPIAWFLAMRFAAICDVIAVFDPKQDGFVVVKYNEGGEYSLGQLIV
jgi:CRISPR-associated protein Csx3